MCEFPLTPISKLTVVADMQYDDHLLKTSVITLFKIKVPLKSNLMFLSFQYQSFSIMDTNTNLYLGKTYLYP